MAVKNKLVYGVGINDANYTVSIYEQLPRTNGKRNQKIIWKCPFYYRWVEMLRRCFCNKLKTKHPTYKDVTCCKEWLTFSNFKSWMEQQDWEGKQLDKDLLVYKNKTYSPETCCFVTQNINKFLTLNGKYRGKYPFGVYYHKQSCKFKSQVSCGERDARLDLGCYLTTEEAHKAWQKEKIKQAKILQSEQTDAMVIKGLQRVIDKIQYDLDNNLITEDF